jgi:hypothetical protein
MFAGAVRLALRSCGAMASCVWRSAALQAGSGRTATNRRLWGAAAPSAAVVAGAGSADAGLTGVGSNDAGLTAIRNPFQDFAEL